MTDTITPTELPDPAALRASNLPPPCVTFRSARPSGEEVLRIDAQGMIYKGVRVEDHGLAYAAFVAATGMIHPHLPQLPTVRFVPVLESDVAVLCEVGASLALYLDNQAPDHVIDVLRRLLRPFRPELSDPVPPYQNPTDLERYEPTTDGVMEPLEVGRWVRYQDAATTIEALQVEVERLREIQRQNDVILSRRLG